MFTFGVGPRAYRYHAVCFSPPKHSLVTQKQQHLPDETHPEPIHARVPALLNVGAAAQVHE